MGFGRVYEKARTGRGLSGAGRGPCGASMGDDGAEPAGEGGVVLGADTRATGGTEVCDKNCEKIHYLADNIYCCGAGTAADTEKTTELISSQVGQTGRGGVCEGRRRGERSLREQERGGGET